MTDEENGFDMANLKVTIIKFILLKSWVE